jgi:hypothetical protein
MSASPTDKKRGLDNFRWGENTQTRTICNDHLRMTEFSFQNACNMPQGRLQNNSTRHD